MKTDKEREIAKEYPEDIRCYPREAFEEQLTQFLKNIKEKLKEIK